MLRLVLAFSLLALPAFAGDSPVVVEDVDSVGLAVDASEAHQQWCAQAGQGDVLLASQAIGPVSDVWGRVSEAWETGGELSLLYWRGMLGQCLSQEELARNDFARFIERAADEAGLRGQVQDARRRLKRLGGEVAAPAPGRAPALVGVGIGAGAAAGVLGGLSGWQWDELHVDWDPLTDTPHTQPDGTAALEAAQEHERNQRGLLAGSIGAGVASAALLVVSAVLPEGAPSVVVVPAEGGLGVSLAVAW